MSKIDILDGFYCIWVAPRDVPKLGVLLPRHDGEAALVAFPLVLPMGWVNSPPFFCAATKTAADLMNQRLKRDVPLPEHRLEAEALAASEPTTAVDPNLWTHLPRYRQRLTYADVYVNDFISLLQGTTGQRHTGMCVLLSTLDEVFRPLQPGDGPHRQEPASQKKLRKGDAAWTTQKTILGWVVDTVQGTLTLPPHWQERLHEILRQFDPTQKRVSVRKWHKLLGELWLMTLAIPRARGLFSVLQTALKYNVTGRPSRVWLTPAVHQFLSDFRTLAASLTNRPTCIGELITQQPAVVGSTDASGSGMGGVIFLNQHQGCVPVVWRHCFPHTVVQDLVTYKNPRGSITNSDLELTATLVQHDLIAGLAPDVAEHTIHSFHDNTPAQYWQRKGSTTTTGPAAYLLRLQSHHQQHHRYVAHHDYLPGKLNRMTDGASCLWHLSDSQFIAYFDRVYPQTRSWTLHPIRPTTYSAVISALARTTYAVASFVAPNSKPTATGICGLPTAIPLPSTRSSPTSLIPFPTSRSSPPGIVGAPAPPTASSAELHDATSVSLTFTTQKNGVRGEVVNHGRSGDPTLCPVLAVARRIAHLRAHDAPQHTILASFYHNRRRRAVLAADITTALTSAAILLGPPYGYTPQDISARSLRAGGAMALFNSQVDLDTIRLIGRWKSDAMLRYLHLQAQPVMRGFACKMLSGGDYASPSHASSPAGPSLLRLAALPPSSPVCLRTWPLEALAVLLDSLVGSRASQMGSGFHSKPITLCQPPTY